MTEDQAFDFATTEYKEISQNVRESWSYTTTLLRQYLLIQILLLSLVGLVYSAISTGGIPVKGSLQTASVSGTAHSQTLIAPPIKGPTQTLGPADASNTAASNTAVDILMGEKDLSKEAKTKRILRNGAIAILIFIGGSFSLGAWSQSSRIFQNSKSFVERGAAIEFKYGTKDLRAKLDEDPPSPMHTYMLSRLNDKKLVKMDLVLSVTYITGVVVWSIALAVFLVPLFFFD